MLSTTQKGFVTNYQKFTELEAAYNTAQQETPSEPPVTPPEEGEKGGCSGTIGIGSAALMLTVLLLGTLYIVLKKKGGNTK